jgi:hypothetical protein
MASTLTNYSNNINVLFPVAGQDNDTQGFRDNWANIKNSLAIVSSEISSLQTNQVELLKDGATVTISGDVAGGAAGAKVILQDATMSTTGRNPSGGGKPLMVITGTSGLTIATGDTTSTTITGMHGGTSWPYGNYFNVSSVKKVEIGSTFKFYSTSTTTYTVAKLTTTSIYTDNNFDPVDLYNHGVTTGTTLNFNVAIKANTVFRSDIPPTTLRGEPGDVAGKMVATENALYVAHKDYDAASTASIWTKFGSNIETNKLVISKPFQIYSPGSPTINATCDLAQGTRFFFDNPGTDLGINFINVPDLPCQVECYVTVRVAPGRSDQVLKVWVNGGAPQVIIPGQLGAWTGTNQTSILWTPPIPTYGYKYWFTLMCPAADSVSVLQLNATF